MNTDVEFHIRQNYPWTKLPANVKQVIVKCYIALCCGSVGLCNAFLTDFHIPFVKFVALL